MIDYEKLKKLHGEELENYLNELVSYWENKLEMTKKLVADRIARDKELTKPEPKYKVGDIAYIKYIDFDGTDKIGDIKITSIHENSGYGAKWIETGNYCNVREVDLFPTPQAIIHHQIEYWLQLRNERIMHEPDTQSNQPQVDADRCQHEEIRTAYCCGKKWSYTYTNWSRAKCHVCGKEFNSK